MEYCQESCFKRFWGNVTVRICKSIDWGCLSRGKDVFPPNKQSAENVRINFAPRVCPKLFRRVMVQHGPLWFLVYQSLRCHVLINHGIILVLVIGGRDYIQPSRRQYVLGIQAVYIYTLPIWWLYATYPLLQLEKIRLNQACPKRNSPNTTNFDVFPKVDVVW